MTARKTLCALVATTAISIGAITFTSCNNETYRERVRQEQVEAQRRIEEVYASAQVIAKYSVPFVEIKCKKTSYTLDPFKHLGNEMKAQTLRLPVSEEYFSSVSVGQELDSKFNTGGLIFKGEFEEYNVSISDKTRNDVFFVRDTNSWREIGIPTYNNQLVALNSQRNEYHIQNNQAGVLTRDNLPEEIGDEARRTCKIVIESTKSNITLDLFKHLENEWNKMRYPIEVPMFLGDKLQVGSEIDQNFVGGSLFFSRSLSIVTYRVLEKKCE